MGNVNPASTGGGTKSGSHDTQAADGPDGGSDAARDATQGGGEDAGIDASTMDTGTRDATGPAQVQGPFPPLFVTDQFDTSRDLAFDGLGHMVARKHVAVLRLSAQNIQFQCVKDSCDDNCWGGDDVCLRYLKDTAHNTTGLRFRADGSFLISMPFLHPTTPDGKPRNMEQVGVRAVPSEGGRWTNIVQWKAPQGTFTDRAGNIWFPGHSGQNTDHPSLNRIGPAPENKLDVLVEGEPLQAPYGIVYDINRKMLFFTEPESKSIHRVAVNGSVVGAVQPVATTTTPGKPWSLVLDELGRLYVITGTEIGDAQQDGNVLRFELDDQGDSLGPPVVMNSEPIPRARGAQFGHGPGFERHSLYIISWPREQRQGGPHAAYDNLPEYVSPVVRLELGVGGDPNSLMGPLE